MRRNWKTLAATLLAAAACALLTPVLLYCLFALFDKGPAWLK